MQWQLRCLSVCLSVDTAEHIRKISLAQVAPTILVFFKPNGMAVFQRGPAPPDGGVEYKKDMKKSRFSTNSSLYVGNDAR